MNNMMKRTWYFAFGYGIIMVLIPFFISTFYLDKKYTIEVDATITRIERAYSSSTDDDEYNVYVTYYYNEEEYSSELHSYSSDFYEGKTIKIFINKDNPYEIMWKTSKLYIPVVFYIFGGILLLISGLNIFITNNKIKKIERIRRTGSTIVASYVGTRVDNRLTYNGKHPYKVMCSWVNPQNNVLYSFESENVWSDPTHEIEGRHIDTFRVFINPSNPYEYSVDIDNIKNNLK